MADPFGLCPLTRGPPCAPGELPPLPPGYRSQRKAAMLEIALATLVYEAQLVPPDGQGGRACRITASALQLARDAMGTT